MAATKNRIAIVATRLIQKNGQHQVVQPVSAVVYGSVHNTANSNKFTAPVGDGHAFHTHLFASARAVNKAVAASVNAGMQSARA